MFWHSPSSHTYSHQIIFPEYKTIQSCFHNNFETFTVHTINKKPFIQLQLVVTKVQSSH